MNNEELKEDLKKEFEKFHDECGMDGNPEMISDWWLQKLSLREQELVQEIEKKAQGAEWVAKMMPNASVVLLSDIQTLIKSNLKGGVDNKNVV